MVEISTQKTRSASLPPENHEIDLHEVFDLIKNNYKLILMTVFVFFIFGLIYANTRPPVYRSVALIEVANNNLAGALGGGKSMSGLSSLQQTTPSTLETILLQSPYILSDVVRKMGMDVSVSPQYSGYFSQKIAQWRNLPHEVSISNLHVPNKLLSKPLTLTIHDRDQYSLSTKNGEKLLDGKVGVLEIGQYLNQSLQIRVNSINAVNDAKFTVMKFPTTDVADALAAGLDIKLEGGDGNGGDSGVLRLSYVASTPEYAQTLLNNVLFAAISKNVADNSAEAQQVLHFTSKQLPVQEKKLENAELNLNQYGVKTGIFDFKAQAAFLAADIARLNEKLESLKLKRDELLQQFTPLHPLVIAATFKEKQLERQLKNTRLQLQQLPVVGQEALNLQNGVKITGSVYTSLLSTEEQMEMMKAGIISGIKILSNATYPVSRVPVKKRVIVFGSMVVGLISSLGFIFIRFVLSPIVEDPEEVERKLGIPVFAIIPYSQRQETYNQKIRRNKQFFETNPFLLAQQYAKDMSIESMRSLRTAIQMALMDVKNNVIAITGCRPGVGKSFISSNLSALMSDLDKKVLLIDADMRLGKLYQCLGKVKTPGLADYLQNKAGLASIIQTIASPKLDFIASGAYPENPSELLSRSSFAKLLQTLKADYDLIIIDTPPVLAVTDSSLVLPLSSVNLLILGLGKDQMKEVQHAASLLEKSGVQLTGIVFNTLVAPKPGTAYAKYAYHYTYE